MQKKSQIVWSYQNFVVTLHAFLRIRLDISSVSYNARRTAITI